MRSVESILRDEGGQVLATLIRMTRNFDLAEDAFQDALVVAVEQWSDGGVPENPGAWLTTVARNKALDRLRRESSRQARETEAVVNVLTDLSVGSETNDLLRLIFTCCHPALSAETRVALTLRTVVGLTTVEIARVFIVPDATIGQRISRAKKKISVANIPYRVPSESEMPDRLPAVLSTLYAVFTAGHHAPIGPLDARADVADEAIRLGRLLTSLMPDEPELWGLLALMLATNARAPARLDGSGRLVLLADQDRSKWDHSAIREASVIVERTLQRRRAGPFQIQAAIACLHGLAPDDAGTDWRQIVDLYRLLEARDPTPVVTVNRAVAESKVFGAAAGLEVLNEVDGLDHWHLYWTTKAGLLASSNEPTAAISAYERALECDPNDTDRHFIQSRLASLQAS